MAKEPAHVGAKPCPLQRTKTVRQEHRTGLAWRTRDQEPAHAAGRQSPTPGPRPMTAWTATRGQCAGESWKSLPAWTAGELGHRQHVERRPPPWCPPPPPGGASGRGATAHTDPWRCHLGVYKTVKRPHLSKVIIYRIFCTKAVFQKRL